MNYPDSVQFLYEQAHEFKTAQFGVEGLRKLLDALGNPQTHGPFIHIAGTNGKGSTAALIEAGLRFAGERTGLYTSPHLVSPVERIRIGGAPVTPETFESAFNLVHRKAEELLASGAIPQHPSYFETMTAMAFVLFAESGIDRAVVEVGMGGIDDATNVLQPELSVVTPIDFDHERFLGNTIAAIAEKKAGILKPGVPAVFARQRPEAEAVLVETAKRLACPFRRTGDAAISDLSMDARGSRFHLDGRPVVCPLAGEHQVDNARTAAVALDQLGIPLDGIAHAVWPGRLEHVATDPEIILDGAHNPAGAGALAAYIRRFYAGRRILLIYGSMRDKAVEEITGILFPLAAGIVITAPRFARALRPEALRTIWPAGNLRVAATIDDALAAVRAAAKPSDVIFVTGSLYVVGEARALLVQ